MKRVMPSPFPSDPFALDATVLGKAVRARRTQAGLSIEEAALSIGVAKQTLSDLEAGKPSVKLGNAFKIAHELGVLVVIAQNQDRDRIARALLESGQ